MKNSYFLLFLGLCNVSNNASMTESEGHSGESNSTVERLIFFIVCL